MLTNTYCTTDEHVIRSNADLTHAEKKWHTQVAFSPSPVFQRGVRHPLYTHMHTPAHQTQESRRASR